MATAVAADRITPEDFLVMPDEDRYELVDGQLVERNMGFQSGTIAGNLHRLLSNHCVSHRLGWVAPADVGYQCFSDEPGKIRKPDVSFIRVSRMSWDRRPAGYCRLAPDLAVEVVSPHDVYSDVEIKVDEYLGAGVRLVWVIDPPSRSVRVHRADGRVTDLKETDDLTGEDVVPGFMVRVADVFADPLALAPHS